MSLKQKELDKLQKEIHTELSCPLKDNATHMVFGKGNANADILFIGEAPGKQEDETGIPFVGRAGQELDKVLRTINLTSDDVYICNILKYRPPKNRNPTREEIKTHTPYLIKQVTIIKPKIIVTLGNYATKFVLANFNLKDMKQIEGISALHGMRKDISINGLHCTIIPMYHPAAMLYNPRLREVFTQDFVVIANHLDVNRKKI